MFINRVDAGKQLAQVLIRYQNASPITLAISDGGVAIGFEIAKLIKGQLSQIMIEKLLYPNDHNQHFGAVAEDGSMYLLPAATSTLSLDEIKPIVAAKKNEINRRIKVLRSGLPIPNINQKVVILVSDGIALGSVIFTAINLCQKNHPTEIVIAAPVSSPEVARALEEISTVNQTFILKQPKYLRRISQVYRNWQEFTESEVIDTMQKWHRDWS